MSDFFLLKMWHFKSLKKTENLKLGYFVRKRYPRMSLQIAIFKFFESFAFYSGRSILTIFMVSDKNFIIKYVREKIAKKFCQKLESSKPSISKMTLAVSFCFKFYTSCCLQILLTPRIISVWCCFRSADENQTKTSLLPIVI